MTRLNLNAVGSVVRWSDGLRLCETRQYQQRYLEGSGSREGNVEMLQVSIRFKFNNKT